jgi:hypothetical protein
MRGLGHLLPEGGPHALQVLQVRVRPILLSFLAGSLQAAEHEFDLIDIVKIVKGARRLLPERAYVLFVISREILLDALCPEELVHGLVARVCPHIEHVVDLRDLRDLLQEDLQELLLLQLQGLDLEVTLALNDLDWRVA